MELSKQLLALIMLHVLVLTAKLSRSSHSVYLSPNYRLLWNIDAVTQNITFELEVKTLGYVTFGFLKDPDKLTGADLVIGWMDRGQVYFQDRHVKNPTDIPYSDLSQDYQLLFGFRNTTHTILRFRRRLNTCDNDYDVPITNNTMRILWSFHSNEAALINSNNLLKNGGVQALYLIQRADENFQLNKETSRSKIWELKNSLLHNFHVNEAMYWCRIFKIPSGISRKHHLIRYEPIKNVPGTSALQQINLYECHNNYSQNMEKLAMTSGRQCHESFFHLYNCNTLIANWAKGSEGFSFPPEVGYPLDSGYNKYFLMETQYIPKNNSLPTETGLRLYYTSKLRTYDAGVISIGIDPNWRHIIPPNQEHVSSSGHCVPDCTRATNMAIKIFAVLTRTHSIGKAVTLRHIRNSIELPYIITDRKIDTNYQEYRRLNEPVTVLPGDHLISECWYNSLGRSTITLGGLTSREEICLVMGLYYPKRTEKSLFVCHSLPSLPTVLHSLGIEELAANSNPVRISSPLNLAGMTLESRLISYDWHNQFQTFQLIMTNGLFKSICWTSHKTLLLPDTDKEHHYPNITRSYIGLNTCTHQEFNPENVRLLDNNQRIENLLKNKVSRDSSSWNSNIHERLGLNVSYNSAKLERAKFVHLIHYLLILLIL